jgi:hypothetical protein
MQVVNWRCKSLGGKCKQFVAGSKWFLLRNGDVVAK